MDRKQLLLEAALRLFASRGYDNTNMKSVAGEAGVAVGLAYTYFASKEALLAAVLADGLQDIEHTLSALDVPGAAPAPRLRRYLALVFDTVQAQRPRWMLLHQLRLHPALRHLLAQPALLAFRARIAERLLAALPPGATERTAAALFAAVDGAVLHLLEQPEAGDAAALAEELAQRFAHPSP